MKISKILIILLVAVFSIGFIFVFLKNNLYKSKATSETVNIEMISDTNLPADTEKTVKMRFTPSSGKISGFDLNLTTDGLQVIRFEAPVGTGVTAPFTKIVEIVATTSSRIVYVLKDKSENLASLIEIPVVVKSTSSGGAGKLKINYSTDLNQSKTQVSGNISSYIFGFGTVTPEITFNPGANVAGNATLNFKLKFQGITGAVPDANKTMPVKITLVKDPSTVVTTSTVNFTVDSSGIWSGSINVNAEAGAFYKILVKGPMHIQKKICDRDPKPTETTAGSYRCATGKITLTAGMVAAPAVNDLDFSGITLLAGDLPLTTTNGQDNVSDAADIGYLINNFDKKDADTVKIGDLNRNGGVDAADFGLIKYALGIKTDEE